MSKFAKRKRVVFSVIFHASGQISVVPGRSAQKMLTKKISSPLYVLVLSFPCRIKLMGKYDLDMDKKELFIKWNVALDFTRGFFPVFCREIKVLKPT